MSEYGLPESWSKDAVQKKVKVELYVPAEKVGGPPNTMVWVEIPTTEVELWVNKNGQADKNRIAKVKFPTMWDTNESGNPTSVVNLFEAFRPEEGETNITYCRVKFRDARDDSADWEVKHFGFIAAIGQSSKRGVSKAWVYDFSRFTDKLPVSVNFNRPTPEAVMETTSGIMNDETPIRLLDEAKLISPQGSVDDVEFSDTVLKTLDLLLVTTIGTVQKIPVKPSAKTFYSNRSTVKDILDWLCTTLNAIWYFEPSEHGVTLVVDAAGDDGQHTRHTYSQPEDDIRVIKNNAVYEIDAPNTVIVRGSRDDGLVSKVADFFDRNEITKRFPYVKVRATDLYESNRVAVGSEEKAELAYLADGDATDVDGAIREAEALMRELLEEESAGSIETYGKAAVECYDVVESHFTCAEDFPEDAISPLHYEVEEVKHHVKAGGVYRTKIYVSIFVGETRIEVVEAYMFDPEVENIE